MNKNNIMIHLKRISLLDENNQEEQIKLLVEEQNYSIYDLILPLDAEHDVGKNVWHVCAKLISYSPDKVLLGVIDDLLVWLEDLNWPGSHIILDRLKLLPKDILKPFVDKKLVIAEKTGDDLWVYALRQLIDG